MIISFKHKGLKGFFERGDLSKIQPKHASRLRSILTVLNAATQIRDINCPGLELHALTGDLNGFWSLKVNGNWRIIFQFEDGDVSVVDYLDYH